MSWSTLPCEIVHHILSYNDAIKYINGKYMNRIPKNDDRYDVLKKILPPYIYKRFTDNFDYTYNSYGFVGNNSSFRLEKWCYPSTTDNPITVIEIKDDANEYTYIQDTICYNWIFYKPVPVPTTTSVPKPVDSFFGRLYSFFGFFLPIQTSTIS